jgi:hypothetical protein
MEGRTEEKMFHLSFYEYRKHRGKDNSKAIEQRGITEYCG